MKGWHCMRFMSPFLGLVIAASAGGLHAEAPPSAVDVAFKAACDGSEQRYVLMKPVGFVADRPHDVLIALHGHGSDRWQFAHDARDECRASRDIAARHAMLFVAPDYRAKTSWMGPEAEADLVQIIGDIRRTLRVGRVFVCGASMGGASALTFAAIHPELIDGAAAMNGTANHLEYDQFQEAIAESFGGSKASLVEEYKKRSAEYWPERLTMPVGLATGGRDAIVPPQSVQRLAAMLKRLNRPVLLIHRDAGGHSTTYEDATVILEYMIQNAKPPPP